MHVTTPARPPRTRAWPKREIPPLKPHAAPRQAASAGRYARSAAAVGLTVLAVLGGCQSSRPPEKVGLLPEGARPPDVIFILVDTLRADRVGAYGQRPGLTPTIDQLAAEGVVFDRAIAPAPWTLPSIASLFCSVAPSVHKAIDYTRVEAMHEGHAAVVSVLSDQFETLAEVMRAAGYQTAAFVANKFIRRRYGFGQGFDHFDDSPAGENTVPGETVNQAAVAWLRQRRSDKPLLLYLHYMDVHGPYDAAPQFLDPLLDEVEKIPPSQRHRLTRAEFRRINAYLRKPPKWARDRSRYDRLKMYREYWVARYEAGVAEFDHYLAQLRDELRSLGIWDDAYIILTSDHGEALCEHGFWEHGYSLYQTDLHVPLILRWPGVLPAGRRVAATVSLLDLMPTLMEQMRIALAGSANIQGRSVIDVLSGIAADRGPVFAGSVKTWPRTPIRHEAVVSGAWKLIRIEQPRMRLRDGRVLAAGTRLALFNLDRDPAERQNLVEQEPQRRDMLLALLDGWRRQCAQTHPGVVAQRVGMSEEEAQHLAAMGYTGVEGEPPDDEPPPATRPATQPATVGATGTRP